MKIGYQPNHDSDNHPGGSLSVTPRNHDLSSWFLPADDRPIRHRLFHSFSLIILLLALFVSLPAWMFQGLPWLARATIILFGITAIGSHWAIRRGHYQPWPMFIIFLVGMNVSWFLRAGSSGPTLLLLSLPVMYLMMFFSGWRRGVLLGIFFANGISLILLEWAYPRWIRPFQNPAARTLSQVVAFSTVALSLVVVFWIVMTLFRMDWEHLVEGENLLKDQKERYHDLFEHMHSGFILMEVILDADGNPVDHRLLDANAEFEAQTGLKREEEIGRTSAQLSFKWPPEMVRLYYDAAINGITVSMERFNESLQRYYDVRAYSPRKGQWAVVFNDISDRKRAEEERKKAGDEIRTLKDRLEAENTFYRAKIQEVEPSNELLGGSDAMKYLLHRVRQVAPSDATVLILGETGTGKELVAEAVHQGGPRKDGPLVKVNCATLPAALAESELFGHERGAFTGAHAQRKGRFELADGATLFLDEVGELSLEVQAKLLRVLQNGEFQRVGGDRSQKVDVRVIAATNRDLGREVAGGRFREDLLYRLNVFPITVPPLRNRPEDIPELAAVFLRRFCEKLGRPELALPHSVINAFQAYSWPGNVRELENVIERAVLVSEPSGLRLAEPLVTGEPIGEVPGALDDILMNFEREQITRVLGLTQWRVEGAQGAAKRLGMKPSTLRSRMSRLGVARPSD
jgi:DNA-binding NtrC family response regulator/PAS domain-containing protein